MTALAPHLAAFLREHLPGERRASRHTCEAYATTFQLLVTFAAHRVAVRPSALTVEQLDAPMILAFLEHLEQERDNAPRSRNARLAAINSFFSFPRVPAAGLSRSGPPGRFHPSQKDGSGVGRLSHARGDASLAGRAGSTLTLRHP
jgi:site-specific recombinase XerD